MVLEIFDQILNYVLWPFLQVSSFWGIFLLSFFISLLTTLAHKYLTDQNLMKQLKDEIDSLKAELKTLKEHPEKQLEVQKKMMETNMKYSIQSFKPLFITFIPIIIIFGWLNSSFAFEPINENQEFSISVFAKPNSTGNISIQAPEEIDLLSESQKAISNGEAIFVLKGKKGDHFIDFSFNDGKYSKKLKIGAADGEAEKIINDDHIRSIKINYKKRIVMNLFGWKLGWLGSYIIFSIIFSTGLRKLLRIY